MPIDITPPLIPEFRSLQFSPGFTLPEPTTDVHRLMMWSAVAHHPSPRTEATAVSVTMNALRVHEPDRDTRRALAKDALQDLISDRLFVEYSVGHMGVDSDLGFMGSRRIGEVKSRLMVLSGLGLQIAGECGRRYANDPSRHFNVRRRGYEIFTKAFKALLNESELRKPQPLCYEQITNRLGTVILQETCANTEQ